MARHKSPYERIKLWRDWIDGEAERYFELSNEYAGHAKGWVYEQKYRSYQGYSDGLKWAMEEIAWGDLSCAEDCTNEDHESRL